MEDSMKVVIENDLLLKQIEELKQEIQILTEVVRALQWRIDGLEK